MNRALLSLAAGALALLLGVVLIWNWGFCRFYIPPGHMAVITSKSGKDLPPGQILAQRGQKGVWEEVLGEGRHFLNPYYYTIEVLPVQEIQPGKVGVVTSKVGTPLPQGEFLAQPGEKGIWKSVLGPGRYRLNPHGYHIQIIDAISIPVGYVGVVTSLSGTKAAESAFAKLGQRGVTEDVLQPGLYYLNPQEFKVDVIEVGVNQVSLVGKEGAAVITKTAIVTQNQAIDDLQIRVLEKQQSKRADYFGESKDASAARPAPSAASGRAPTRARDEPNRPAPAAPPANKADSRTAAKATQPQTQKQPDANFILRQHIGFPSRDGFDISLDMTVEFEFLPQNIAGIFRDYGDMPAVVEKVLMPQILSVSRLKGSGYKAVEFIAGDARAKFQDDLTKAIETSLQEKKINTHSALIRHVNVPVEILAPLQQASIATEQDLANKEIQKTQEKLAELNTETQMITQKGAEVMQETAKMKAETEARKDKLVAEIEADADRQVALVQQQTAEILAQRDITTGEAAATATTMVEGENAKGLSMKAKALGDAHAFNLAEFARALNPQLSIRILHSGPGTLWTDLEKMSVGTAAAVKTATRVEPKPPENKR